MTFKAEPLSLSALTRACGGDVVLINLKGRLAGAEVKAFGEAWTRAMSEDTKVVLFLCGETELLVSLAVREIFVAHRECQVRGGFAGVVGARGLVLQTLEGIGTPKGFLMADGLENALMGLFGGVSRHLG